MTAPSSPIAFGTDGWRGQIAGSFTFERLRQLAPPAAQVLAEHYGDAERQRPVLVGYDRRFMAEDFAQAAADAVRQAGFNVWLAQTYAPTPALSWAARNREALGALVITASHNPAGDLGVKLKGSFGGSVPQAVAQQVEARLTHSMPPSERSGHASAFDPWPHYCQALRERVDCTAIRDAIASGELTVWADAMHGAAAGGLSQLLELPIGELRSERDPTFGDGAPEPLPQHLSALCRQVRRTARGASGGLRLGLAFDGDGDRIAAIDGRGNVLSAQALIPLLVDRLARQRGLSGEVVKTVSGSDLIAHVAAQLGLPVCETPVGYKHVADRMLAERVLLGGEESGGIGYGTHIPERDALLSALYLLETVALEWQDLSARCAQLQRETGFSASYDRLDLPLADAAARDRVRERLQQAPPDTIAGRRVRECTTQDGHKFRLEDGSWLLIRCSGTEPLLRLYCEAPTAARVRQTLDWARQWTNAN
ncbi:MAG: phosphoglucosamine mutase [Cyanobacteria bacterium QS_8_64_29]|nr:MAG: phosphoglucosamine mutase [Cyanobacteria bacterium QS_8_64_29]